MIGTVLTVAKEEGPRALYSGLAPGLQRQICFCTVRLGFYDHVRNSYVQLFGGKLDQIQRMFSLLEVN
jgi:solute carrier family 25 uncoupling protein 8/9